MNDEQAEIARLCKDAAEENTMAFPQIVEKLMQVGFERYAVDYCKATVTYYLPDGDNITLEAERFPVAIPASFDVDAIQAAIRQAQSNAPGYTHKGFCKTVMAAGCAGYVVSFIGRRAVYAGRTAEMHVEHFPQ